MSDENAQGLNDDLGGRGELPAPETLTERGARGKGGKTTTDRAPEPLEAEQGAGASQAPTLQEQVQELQSKLSSMDKTIDAAKSEAEERAFRRAQSKLDADLQRLQKRYAEREQRLLEALPSLGLDANQVRALQQERSREDEIEALREQAALAQGYQAREAAVAARAQYITFKCREAEVDPNDPRLDVSSPEAFDRSLMRVVKQDAVGKAMGAPSGAYGERGAKAQGKTAKGMDEERKAANKSQVEPLGGAPGVGGKSGETLHAELQQKLKELRGSGRLADAMAILREYRENIEKEG